MCERSQSSFDALHLDLALQIDELCQRFEADWRAGRQPRVDDYLAQVTEPGRKVLGAELAALERELRQPPAGSSDPDRASGMAGEAEAEAGGSAGTITEAPTLALKPSSPVTTPAHVATAIHQDTTIPPHGAAGPSPAVEPTQKPPGGDAGADREPVPGPIRYFGDYEILRELARGGMGVVFLARQLSLNRPVALKMILAGQLANETDVRRFYTEAEAAANLDHPGIVPIFEVGQHEGQHYFSMGFVEGQSLSQRLAGGPLPAREAAELIRRVSEAIDYAHRRGVIHRDLKPANILLDQQGNPRVTDFGLAKKVEGDSGLTGSGQIMGTPSYMPPEQAGGRRGDVGPAADVYALGATLYALATGRPPFQAAAVMDTVLQVISDEPVPLRRLNPAVEPDLETICLKCLEKDAARRYPSAAALGEDLGRYLAGEPILARPVTGWERAAKWARRNPAIAGLAASLVLAVVAGFAAVTSQWLRAESLRKQEALQRRLADELSITAEARRRDAEAERQEAERQKRAAEEGRAEAEANFALARGAVDDFFTSVSESRLMEVPGLQPLRRELLGSARHFYAEFLRRKGNDAGLRLGSAAAQVRFARINAELGGPAAAEPDYRQALAAFEALAREHTQDAEIQARLADSLRGLALALPRDRESVGRLDRARRIRTDLAAARPQDERLRLDLARVQNDLAEELCRSGRPAEALGWYVNTRDIEQELVRNHPDEPDRLYTLGDTLDRIARLQAALGRHADASMIRLEAIEHLRAARRRAPRVLAYGRLLGSLFEAEAESQAILRNQAKALDALEQCVDVRQVLARDNPGVPGVQSELIAGFRALAAALRAAHRSADADRRLGQARAVIEGLPLNSAEDFYNLACVRARSVEMQAVAGAETVTARTSPAAVQDDALRHDAGAAVDALRQAIRSGFKDLDRLKQDPDLAAVRDRADFRQLVAQLEQTVADELIAGRAPKPTSEGLQVQEKAVAAREQAARANPNDPRLQAELARTHYLIGVMRYGIGMIDPGVYSLDMARTIQEALVRDHPAEPSFRIDLCSTVLAEGTAHADRGRVAAAQRSWRRGLKLIEAASAAPGPAEEGGRNAALIQRRAAAHLQVGRGYAFLALWSEARAEFATAFRLAEPSDLDDWLHYATLLKVLGDDAAYGRLVTRLLAKFGRLEDAAQSGQRAVLAAALAPGAGGDPPGLLALAESALASEPQRSENRLTLALARLRAGQQGAAIADLEAARRDFEASVWFAREPIVWPLLALAHAATGRRNEARRWLDRADSYVDHALRLIQNGPQYLIWLPLPWQEWAAFLVLRREAWITCRGAPPPEDARARLVSGLLRTAMGFRPAAQADLEAVVARTPDDPRAWIELGRFRAEAGLSQQADAALARAAKLAAGDPQIFGDRAWWVAGPLPAGFTLDPAIAVDPAQPLGSATPGGQRLLWSSARTGGGGWIDFKRAIGLVGSVDVAALGLLHVPADRDATLAVDASKPARVWLNGRLVHAGKGRASRSGLDHDLVPVRLRQGRNALLAQTSVSSFDHCLFLRFANDAVSPEAPSGPSGILADADEPALRAWLASMRQGHYRPGFVHADVDDGQPRFAALAFHDPERLPWECRIDPNRDSWDRTFETLRSKYRPVSLSCFPRSGATAFVSIWHPARYPSPESWFVQVGESREAITRLIDDKAEAGLGLQELIGYPEAGSIRFAAIGAPIAADWWYLRDHDAEPLIRDAVWKLSQGLHPLSLTSYPDGGRSRFAMALARDNPAVQTILQIDLTPRSFACSEAHWSSLGFRPRYLTPYLAAGGRRLYMGGWTRSELPAGGEAVPALAGLETVMTDFMRERSIQGGTLALAKSGRLLMARSYGWADRNATRPLAPGDPMRLASLSKNFTAAVIHRQIDAGKLRSDTSVVELLDLKPPTGRTMDPRWKRVTIDHLLTHRGGWDRDAVGDPLDRSLEIAAALGHPGPATDIVHFMAGQPLQFDPGSKEVYSNFGYCLLGRVIEKVSGRAYVDALRADLLEPLDIRGVALGRSLPENRHPREPEYVHPFWSRNIFSTDSTTKVHEPDGGLSIEAWSSASGLIAPAADVARFFSHYGGPDGRPNPPDDEHRIYFGEMPGTFSMALRLPGNLVIVVLFNQRVAISGSPMDAISVLMEQAAAKVRAWPTTEINDR